MDGSRENGYVYDRAQGVRHDQHHFDTLGYFEKLKAAGVPEAQAKVQVEVMQGVVRQYDEASRKELATKNDLQETKHEILKWMMATMVAQTALIVAVIAFLK